MNSNIVKILNLFSSYQPYIENLSIKPDSVGIFDVLGDPDNEVLTLVRDFDEEYRISFTERNLGSAQVMEGRLHLEDDSGEEFTISFLETRKLLLFAEDIA